MKQSKWLILAVLAIVWGSSFILIKRGLLGLTPIQLGAVRVFVASIVMLCIGWKHIPTIPKTKWKFLFASSMYGIFFPAFLFAYAQTQIDSTISSILNATTPLFTLFLSVLIFGISAQKRQYFGVIIGFIGSLMLILSGAIIHTEQNYWYALLAVLACVLYALNINWIKKFLSDLSPIQISMGSFTCLLPCSIIVLLNSNLGTTLHLESTQTAIIYTAILGICSTGLASLLFYRLIIMSSPVFASSTTYLIPVVAFMWGIFDHESIHISQLAGALVVLVGVYLSSRK